MSFELSVLNLQQCAQFRFVKINHDGAVNVEGRRGAVAVSPFLHLLGCAGGGGDIHLCEGQFVVRQPLARAAAVTAPFGAIHYDSAMGQSNRLWLGFFGAVAHRGIHPADDLAQLIIGRLVVFVVDIDVADNPLLVDDEDGALGVAFGSQYAVVLGHRAVRPKVAQQRVVDAAQALCPGFETIG